MKYIDAEKLIAEIQRRKYEWQAILDKNNVANPEAIKNAIYEDENILDFVTSLQQEQQEVDLDRATIESYSLPLLNRQVSREELDKFARHFYELGLSTMRKRLADPEYNREAIEKMKSEYPVDESNAKKL